MSPEEKYEKTIKLADKWQKKLNADLKKYKTRALKKSDLDKMNKEFTGKGYMVLTYENKKEIGLVIFKRFLEGKELKPSAMSALANDPDTLEVACNPVIRK